MKTISNEYLQVPHAEAHCPVLPGSVEQASPFFDLLDDFVFLHPLDHSGSVGPFTFVNAAACRALGYTREEMTLLTPADLTLHEPGFLEPDQLHRLTREGHLIVEHTLRTRNGRPVEVQLRSRTVEGPNGMMVFTIGRDLRQTAPLRAELRVERQRLAGILDALDAHIALLDEDGTILKVNRPWSRFARDNGGDPMAVGPGANYLDELRRVPSEREVLDRMLEVLAGREDGFVREYSCDGPNEPRTFRMTVAPYPGPDAQGLVVVHENVTAARAAEQLLLERSRTRGALLRRERDYEESERRRHADTLENRIGQGLAALHMDLGTLEDHLREDPEAREIVAKSLELATDIADAAHTLQAELRPPMLDLLGLVPALEWYVAATTRGRDLDVRWSVDGRTRARSPEPEVAIALYRILQEALANVLEHADASALRIELRSTPSWSLVVEDDGVGMPDPLPPPDRTLGLLDMEERIRALGGDLRVTRPSSGGTRLTASIDPRYLAEATAGRDG